MRKYGASLFKWPTTYITHIMHKSIEKGYKGSRFVTDWRNCNWMSCKPKVIPAHSTLPWTITY